jgi:hypothetical protein
LQIRRQGDLRDRHISIDEQPRRRVDAPMRQSPMRRPHKRGKIVLRT